MIFFFNMRIGIDARLWGEEENRGLGRYVKELILNLEKLALDVGHQPPHLAGQHDVRHLISADDFFIFLRKNNFNQYQPASPNFHKILWDAPWYTLKEQIPLFSPFVKGGGRRPGDFNSPFVKGGGRRPGDFNSPFVKGGKRGILDLVHFPHWNVPYFYNRPFVVTIHDLILLESNRQREATTLGKTRYALKFAGFKMILKHALFNSQKIIAISETTKQSILQHFPNLPSAKIEVVYNGVTSLNPPQSPFSKGGGGQNPPQSPFSKGGSKGSFKTTQPYLLYVGSAYPHKNLEFLIKAFADFISEIKNNPTLPPLNLRGGEEGLRLVLVGREDFFYKRLKEKYKAAPIIIFFGQVSDQELGTLYKNAMLFVSSSFQEGFGLPPLEAALLGAPSLLSDIGAFREVMGDLAVYFNPHDKDDLKTKLQLALNDYRLRDKMIKAQNELKQKFNWLNCAQSTLNIYHQSV